MPDIPQIVLWVLGIVSTGFVGLLIYLMTKSLNALESMLTAQNKMNVSLGVVGEQIKTLFHNDEKHEKAIETLSSRVQLRLRRAGQRGG